MLAAIVLVTVSPLPDGALIWWTAMLAVTRAIAVAGALAVAAIMVRRRKTKTKSSSAITVLVTAAIALHWSLLAYTRPAARQR